MINGRHSTGKRLRFEVFKRDYFTCQYCGAQPPGVVLVVDHVTPVAAGGPSTEDNLLTACEPCNQGKSDRPLGDRIVRPDADLLYLQTQQEVAELRHYQAAVAAREGALAGAIDTLHEQWMAHSGLDWHPSDQTMRGLITQYGIDVSDRAVAVTAGMLATRYLKPWDDNWLKYLRGVARNMAREQEGGDGDALGQA